MENKDKAAFPLSGERWQQDIGRGVASSEYQGLTKREYFAAMAMQGLVNREGWAERFNDEVGDNSLVKILAVASVKMADELLKALEK